MLLWLFWLFMLVMVLLTPIVMVVFGRRFRKHPPEKINAAFGYRINRSMKNMDTWIFAHHYIGTLWNKCGIFLSVFSAIVMLFALGKDVSAVGYIGLAVCVVQCMILVGTIFPTEHALKKAFDKNGSKLG